MKINKLSNIVFMSILSFFTINNFAMEEKNDNKEIKNENLNNNSSYFSRFKSYFSSYINPKFIYNKIKNKYTNMQDYISNYVNNNKYAKHTLFGLGGVVLASTGYGAYKYWKHKNVNSRIEESNDSNLIEDFELDNFSENEKEEIDYSKVLENNESLEDIKFRIFSFISENLSFLRADQLKIINIMLDDNSYLDAFIAENKNFPYSDKSTEDNIEILVTFFQNKFLEK